MSDEEIKELFNYLNEAEEIRDDEGEIREILDGIREIHACTMIMKERAYRSPKVTKEAQKKIDHIFRNFKDYSPKMHNLEKEYDELFCKKNYNYKNKNKNREKEQYEVTFSVEELKKRDYRVKKLRENVFDAEALEAYDFRRIHWDANKRLSDRYPDLLKECFNQPPEGYERIWEDLVYYTNTFLLKKFSADPAVYKNDWQEDMAEIGSRLFKLRLSLEDYIRDYSDSLNASGIDHVRQLNDLLLKFFD